MRFLNQFNKFDLDSFLDKKVLKVTGCSKWKDFNTKEELGTKIETVIVRDDTEYTQKGDEIQSNLYEKFVIKVAKSISIKPGTFVVPVDGTAVIYGDYRNQLSVKASDVKEIEKKQ